jgi:hypothetical protein
MSTDVHPVSGPITWQGHTVDVQAWMVPRYLWTTASIDVYLDGQLMLATGGQLEFVGSYSSTFVHAGATHTAELSWGSSGLSLWFPYQLRIDSVLVAESRVHVRNGLAVRLVMAGICAALLASVYLVLAAER